MSTLQQKLVSSAIAGAFVVAADYVLEEVGKEKYTNIKNKELKMFALGFSASLLQQYVSPMLL